ncbi:FAD-dependent oxidoreductase [Streptomyces sp. PTM05]|uniref:FAD-dependent oxidoreductase n=1 Tax=Streptantibioticus parmotrematis TaxID=2873249 RepID=A0ABS7QS30_9ACTN|nr:FAD-dependent oxidoreductase [Streptantibioticus parmotrematis]MBY8885988.1 FAD-dependent oxidoreductase [Streptantibioticus parmotrematis]
MAAAPERVPSRIVVVGASAAGLTTVEALRRFGHDGALTLIGDEPHLPYDRPPLSKQLLDGTWEPDRLRLRAPEALDALGLDLRLGTRATALDTDRREVCLADGERVGYDALVVATGLSARRLPGTRGLAGAHVLRTLDDALALRESLRGGARLVVVGGGFVGAEAAAVARTLGAEVTLVTDEPAPLADALGAEVAGMLAGLHRAHGVRLSTGVPVREVTADAGAVTGVRLADGRLIEADAVLMGIGADPNTGWLRGSGLRLDNGVVCDATLRADDGVWAAGDIANWPAPEGGSRRVEHRTNAAEQGIAVARAVLAGPEAAVPFETVPYVWSDQYDLRLQTYGRTRGAERVRVVEGGTDQLRLVAVYGTSDRVTGIVGVNLPRRTRAYRRLLTGNAASDENAVGAGWDAVDAIAREDAAPVPQRTAG